MKCLFFMFSIRRFIYVYIFKGVVWDFYFILFWFCCCNIHKQRWWWWWRWVINDGSLEIPTHQIIRNSNESKQSIFYVLLVVCSSSFLYSLFSRIVRQSSFFVLSISKYPYTHLFSNIFFLPSSCLSWMKMVIRTR